MRFLVYIVPIVLLVYCWVEIAQSDPRQVRQLPRGLWALVVLIPLAGPIGWLLLGRRPGSWPPTTTPSSFAASGGRRTSARRRPKFNVGGPLLRIAMPCCRSCC